MERRHDNQLGERPTALPPDYLKLVANVFTEAYAEALERLAAVGPRPSFRADGALYRNEILLQVSLVTPGRTGATTVHASCDFDAAESEAADAEKRLADCVDAIGMVFSTALEPEALPKLRGGPLTRFAEFPAGWNETAVRDRTIYLLVDSADPELESMADAFLAQHEPEAPAAEEAPKPKAAKPRAPKKPPTH